MGLMISLMIIDSVLGSTVLMMQGLYGQGKSG